MARLGSFYFVVLLAFSASCNTTKSGKSQAGKPGGDPTVVLEKPTRINRELQRKAAAMPPLKDPALEGLRKTVADQFDTCNNTKKADDALTEISCEGEITRESCEENLKLAVEQAKKHPGEGSNAWKILVPVSLASLVGAGVVGGIYWHSEQTSLKALQARIAQRPALSPIFDMNPTDQVAEIAKRRTIFNQELFARAKLAEAKKLSPEDLDKLKVMQAIDAQNAIDEEKGGKFIAAYLESDDAFRPLQGDKAILNNDFLKKNEVIKFFGVTNRKQVKTTSTKGNQSFFKKTSELAVDPPSSLLRKKITIGSAVVLTSVSAGAAALAVYKASRSSQLTEGTGDGDAKFVALLEESGEELTAACGEAVSAAP